MDFEQLMLNGIIINHFPLHRRNSVDMIQNSFFHYYERLKIGFLFGSYPKYFQPLNMIKNYYGEKFAFEYAFLIHYQSWLYIPSCLGVLMTAYQLIRLAQTGSFLQALDTPLNAIYGLIVSFWATIFVESWKRKQTMIQFFWGASDSSYSNVDERKVEFRYYSIYNKATDQLEKRKQVMKKKQNFKMAGLSYLFIAIVLASMIVYQILNQLTKPQYNEKGEKIKEQTILMKIQGFIYTTVYSIIVILFGTLYKDLAYKYTEDENYRYQKQHSDAIIKRLFRFNFFNFYFPMLWVAFDGRNNRRYSDLFNMMAVQMGVKQIVSNVIEYI